MVKLLNVAKFIGGFGAPAAGASATHPLDTALLLRLEKTVAEATAAFEGYDYTKALLVTETFFWSFCDDYVELVKNRAYQQDGSALATLKRALDIMLQLFAPVLPFVTEEVWSNAHDESIHRSRWPDSDALGVEPEANAAHLDEAATMIPEIRKAKRAARVSLRPVDRELNVHASADQLKQVDAVADARR